MKRMAMIVAAALAGSTAFASIDQKLESAGWNHLTFDDKTANEYALGDTPDIQIRGDGSVSVLWRSIDEANGNASDLSWRWRVDQGPPPTDLTQKGGDDRPLSLYVSFEFDPERSSFWERSKRAVLQPFVDVELPGRVLLYVWGGETATDEWIDSPYFSGVGKMRILRAADAPLGTWIDERVDLLADYREAFDEEPTAAYQIAISSDSDDTQSVISARIGDIQLGDLTLN